MHGARGGGVLNSRKRYTWFEIPASATLDTVSGRGPCMEGGGGGGGAEIERPRNLQLTIRT